MGDDDREILTLTYWDGLTAEQVAAVFGISPAAARKRLQRARERLSACMTRAEGAEGWTREDDALALARPRGREARVDRRRDSAMRGRCASRRSRPRVGTLG